jgi:hypothetical protein
MEEIIDCVKNADGVYIPDAVVDEPDKKPKKQASRRRQRASSHPQPHVRPYASSHVSPHVQYQPIFMYREVPGQRTMSPLEDFMIGVDAGMDIFEQIVERAERFNYSYYDDEQE